MIEKIIIAHVLLSIISACIYIRETIKTKMEYGDVDFDEAFSKLNWGEVFCEGFFWPVVIFF
jgi:hypothetical protein